MNVTQQTKWLAYGEAFDTEHDARRFHEAYDVAKVYYQSLNDAIDANSMGNPRALAYLFYDAFLTLDKQRREVDGKVISPTDKVVTNLASQVVTLETKLAKLILAAGEYASFIKATNSMGNVIPTAYRPGIDKMTAKLADALAEAQSDVYLEGVSHD